MCLKPVNMFWQLYTFLCCLLKLLFYTVTVQAASASNKNKIIKRLLQCAFLVCVYVQGLMCDWVWPSSYCYFLCLSSITLTTLFVPYYMYTDHTLFVTLPFKMSQMDTRPLSPCGLFSKEASIFKIWGFQQNHIAVFFASEIILLMHN